MKEAMSSFDVAAIVAELQRCTGWRVDKIYHPRWDRLVVSLRGAGEGKEYLHFHVGKWLYLSKGTQEMPQQPSSFAMMLRKRVMNARVAAVRQQGFDRIVVLTLEKDGTFDLILELFGDGNAILVKDGAIVQPLTSRTWKHRDVKAKMEFSFPPPVPDVRTLEAPELLGILRSSDSDLVRTIATRLNVGGRYSEEVCARTGLPPDSMASSLTDEQSEAVRGMVKELIREATLSGKGLLVSRDGIPEDVVPLTMKTYAGLSSEEFGSFSEAVEAYVARKPAARKEKRPEADKDLGKIKRRVAQQEAAVMRLQDEAREAQIAGDELFAQYADVDKAISEARRRVGEQSDLEDLPGFVDYDGKKALLTVDLGGKRYTLDVKGTVESNAQRYYEESKRARKKLEGVLKVLQDTRAEAEGIARKDAEMREKKTVEPTKRFWFERYRWFISSDGAIVLGGKDAKSNDTLVKKHLEAGDRYAHADMHGAPSVVVKMTDGVTDATLREACEFAVATSKAWNARIGSASGYWVLPEQVSKTPQSGEYLAKGAFVIRGKRNYSDKLDIKLAVGEIEHEGKRKVMGGPESAVKARSEKFVVLRPGDTGKDLVAKTLAHELEVPIEEVQSVMPPGDVDVVEVVGLRLEGINPR
jgi:predicted ribosome quality control (RQC) complex YloA/Tae2 family protein